MGLVHVIGNATVDLIQRVARLPRPGETLLASGMTRCAGGKGLNQAVAAARTGAKTRLTAPVGRDAEAAFLADAIAAEKGLVADWLTHPAATDLSVIWVAEGGENAIVSSADCARSLSPQQAEQACEGLGAGDILLMQGNLTAETTCAAARAAAGRGARCILNTAPIAWDMRDALPLFDIVIANAGEAAALSDGSGDPVGALLGQGVELAIITLGPQGVMVGAKSGAQLIPAPKVTAIDTAGAGDVFAGTLAGLLAQGADLPEAAAVAVRAASLSVTRQGTTLAFPTCAEIQELRAGAS